jgi:ankyrin repeat protein
MHGFDVNARSREMNTPLHYAFQSTRFDKDGAITILRYLLSQCNIDVDRINADGRNSLHKAKY